MDREVLNQQDLKDIFGIGNRRLYALIKQGMPNIKMGGKYVFLRTSIMTWLKSQEKPSKPPVIKQEVEPDKKLVMPR